MSNGFLGSLTAMLASAGLALAQSRAPANLPPLTGPLALRSAEQPALPAMAEPDADPDAESQQCRVKRPAPPIWVSAEYLLWWIKNSPFPPLVTTGPVESGGILNAPGSVVVAGGGNIDYEEISGGRISLGFWFDQSERVGVEGNFLWIGSRSFRFSAVSPTGQPIIALPFFDINTGVEDAELFAFPNTDTASIDVTSSSRMRGGEVNGVVSLGARRRGHFDFLLGFRYLELDEDLSMLEDIHVDPGFNVLLPNGQPLAPSIAGERIRVADTFSADNSFYGFQLGARTEMWWGNVFANVRAKVALGAANQAVDVNGMTAELGRNIVHAGGVLALPSNVGHFKKDKFAVVPEVGVNVGYQFGQHWRAFAGYNFLYWNTVARPGLQIDRNVHGQQIPLNNLGGGPIVGPIGPTFTLHDTDFWAHGVNFGVEFIF